MSKADWREAEAMAMRGMSLAGIARRFGIRDATVRQRASRCEWPTPDRIARKKRMAARLAKEGLLDASEETVTTPTVSTEASPVPDNFSETLLAAIQTDPEQFRQAIARAAQTSLAESASNIPLPRTLGEWSRMVDILVKATGAAGKGAGPVPIVSPLRSLRRNPRVVGAGEASGDSIDGFVL